jgi:hypothetical protein
MPAPIAVTWIVTALILGLALGAFFGYGAGFRHGDVAPQAPEPPPRRVAEWPELNRHASREIATTPMSYQPRHGLPVMGQPLRAVSV